MNWYKYSQNEPNRLSPEEEAELQELMRLQQQAKVLEMQAKDVMQNIENLARLGEAGTPGPYPQTAESDILNEFEARRNKQQRKAQADPRVSLQQAQQRTQVLEAEIAKYNEQLNILTQRFMTTHQDRSQWGEMVKQRWVAQATPIQQSLKLTQSILAKNKLFISIVMRKLQGRSGQMPQASTKRDISYYKIAQTMTQPELRQEYESAEQEANSGVRFRGMGMSEILTIPGSNTPIAASEL